MGKCKLVSGIVFRLPELQADIFGKLLGVLIIVPVRPYINDGSRFGRSEPDTQRICVIIIGNGCAGNLLTGRVVADNLRFVFVFPVIIVRTQECIVV